MKKLIFLLLVFSNLYSQEVQDSKYFLKKAIENFSINQIKIAEQYILKALEKETEIQNTKEYLKLQFFINFLDKRFYHSNQYFFLLEQSHYLDDFLIYIKILDYLNFKDYQKLQVYLKEIQANNLFDKEEFSILPFSCKRENYEFQNQLKKYKNKILWRDFLTKTELEFINFLKEILIFKNRSFIPKIEECLKSNQDFQNLYHLYRFLIFIEPDIKNYFEFYKLLYQNKQYLEALYVLRVIYSMQMISYEHPDFYLLFLNFKKIYQKLNYQKNVDTLDRFLNALIKKSSIEELKKIATENYNCRELIIFLIHFSESEEQKNFFTNKLNQYDLNFDSKEKISYYKTIYQF